jgi:hypothetical protein
MKKPEHNPLHFERAYLVHLSLDWSISYRLECTRWRTTKLFEVLKAINHRLESYNDSSLSVQ